MLFNCFIFHGYLPPESMKTAIFPIIKNKTGDTNDKINYRSIALVTNCSKIFELCICPLLKIIFVHKIISWGLISSMRLIRVFIQ